MTPDQPRERSAEERILDLVLGEERRPVDDDGPTLHDRAREVGYALLTAHLDGDPDLTEWSTIWLAEERDRHPDFDEAFAYAMVGIAVELAHLGADTSGLPVADIVQITRLADPILGD